MENYIGIDISINSTAVYIENDRCQSVLSFTNKKDNNIYIKELDRCGVVFFHHIRDISDNYSENEILKLHHYSRISNLLVDEIIKRIDTSKKTYCQIEGYSFSKNTSSILDIVSFSTLIKSNLINSIPSINMSIISPSTLKLETCKLVYPPINIGKKKVILEFRNNHGISGGSFKKPDMYRAMLDGSIKSPIYEMLASYRHLMERGKIPNPIEDIIDSIFACKIKINEIENDNR